MNERMTPTTDAERSQIAVHHDGHGNVIVQDLYDMGPGCYCGVYMPERVMKKIARLESDYMLAVKRVLTEHEDELFASDWTLANKMDGDKIAKQVTIRYAERGKDVRRRIELFKPVGPVHQPTVYLVENYLDAKPIAESVLTESLNQEPRT